MVVCGHAPKAHHSTHRKEIRTLTKTDYDYLVFKGEGEGRTYRIFATVLSGFMGVIFAFVAGRDYVEGKDLANVVFFSILTLAFTAIAAFGTYQAWKDTTIKPMKIIDPAYKGIQPPRPWPPPPLPPPDHIR